MHGPTEVEGIVFALEADDIGTEDAVEDLVTPRQLCQLLDGREGNVVEESDADVGALGADHLGHELQVVVVDPHHGIRGCGIDGGLRESGIDVPIRSPPRAMDLRSDEEAVVQRPEGGAAEALVIATMLVGAQRNRDEPHVVEVERCAVTVMRSGPADPRATVVADDGRHG